MASKPVQWTLCPHGVKKQMLSKRAAKCKECKREYNGHSTKVECPHGILKFAWADAPSKCVPCRNQQKKVARCMKES